MFPAERGPKKRLQYSADEGYACNRHSTRNGSPSLAPMERPSLDDVTYPGAEPAASFREVSVAKGPVASTVKGILLSRGCKCDLAAPTAHWQCASSTHGSVSRNEQWLRQGQLLSV